MTTQKWVTGLAAAIAGLALIAAGAGVLTTLLGWPAGAPYTVTSLRGEPVAMQGYGLYRFDTVSGAAQEIAQDAVTLLLGLPLLVAATVAAARGSLRGRLVQVGTLAYFLYTYLAMAMLTAYNELFLGYVALFSLSTFACVLAVRDLDVAGLPAHISAGFPRRAAGGFALAVAGLVALLWLGRIGPALLAGTPPAGLETYTTLVIQVIDLGLIVPAAGLTGVLVLRRAALGYLLALVVLVFGLSMGAALTAMIVGQVLAGVDMSPVEAVAFPALLLVNGGLGIWVLRAVRETPGGVDARPYPRPPVPRPGQAAPEK